jgi:hypothetical protein
MSKVYTFAQFLFESKKQMKTKEEMTKSKKKAAPAKKKAAKKKDQDGDGDMDFADAKVAQYAAGGMDKGKAVAMSRKFNKPKMNEGFSFGKKEEDSKKNPLAKIKKGQTIVYKDEEYAVVSSDEYTLTVKNTEGKEKKINAKMFKESGKLK